VPQSVQNDGGIVRDYATPICFSLN
jgi:hypothetical protein